MRRVLRQAKTIRVTTYHVLVRSGAGDAYQPTLAAGTELIGLAMDGAVAPDHWRLDEDVWTTLAEDGLKPSTPATDFMRVAVAAYSADLRVPHSSGFDRWSREIVLHLPVQDLAAWQNAMPDLLELLGFLTGDRWSVELRQLRPTIPRAMIKGKKKEPRHADTVCLLSGGLDSAIGALDLLTEGHEVALVSHNSKSGGAAFSSPAQRRVLEVFKRSYDSTRMRHVRFRLQPPAPHSPNEANETSTRSRSILFFALGILVATALDRRDGGNIPLVIPENGLISLNVPLTRSRQGSWSTRTTHPHTLALVRAILSKIGVGTPLLAPYAQTTKGEMILNSRDPVLAKHVAKVSVSCAHPNQGRFLPVERRGRNHCGTCVPCIIRRAAMLHAGIDSGTDYSFRLPQELRSLDTERGSDSRAYLVALGNRRRPVSIGHLLRSGPLHLESDDDLQSLVRVYDAGMDEVARLLNVPVPK